MGRRFNLAALAITLCVAACGGGGGGAGSSGNGGTGNSTYGVVELLSHAPADQAVQVPADVTIELQFDAPMAIDSFGDEDTWLRKAGSDQNVPGTFSRGTGGRVAFAPASPLDLETDYEFQISGLTCDESGRILDTAVSFGFRTFDATPPELLAVDVVDNSTNQSRTRSFALTFSESLAPASVTDARLYLRDGFGIRYGATRTVDGATVTLAPDADLPGDRQFWLIASAGMTDRAGNALASTTTRRFRTEVDLGAPRVLSSWPPTARTGVSPRVQPTFRFDESMDPATVETASLLFQDQFGSIVPFAIESSRDQRTLRVRPTVVLQPHRNYTMAFLLGGAGATDVSGNVLSATQALAFTTGDDVRPPGIASSTPTAGETRVPGSVGPTVEFDEPLDAAWVDATTVTMTVDGEPWTCVVETPTPTSVRILPVLALPTNSLCRVRFAGGHEGLRDLAGNVLATDQELSFTTSADAGLPNVLMLPPDAAAGVAPGSRVTFVFDAPMDPATLTSATMQVLTDQGQPVAGALAVTGGNRIVTFTPASPLSGLTYYRLRVVGGSAGVRRTSGNWFAGDQTARFRTGGASDVTPPTVTATMNSIHASRTPGLLLPPSGFTIDVTTADSGNQWVDMGSVEILLEGPGGAPHPAALLANADIGYGSFEVVVPADASLAAGNWTLTVRARDLSGNTGSSLPLSFAVAVPDGNLLPFERTQVVWVRTDLDRDSNGTPDFDDDLLRLGLATAGDPIGTNSRMRSLVLDGILAQGNRLYGRGDRGEPLGDGSVGLRFTRRPPIAIPHMQMALGGYDPDGDRQRTYGDESTGVLGRAYYDYRNGNPGERNISNSPGLGVFPGEMWLYQTKIHEQVWPSFTTVFAQRFRPLCPQMTGVPAGAHALDPVVLAPSFDYATATTSQRARWSTIMAAADDWATVIGIILAHEVGHSVGLVAPGVAPAGLFGDSSLHDTYSSAAEVMAASVGYEAMTTLDYKFRDIDLAYLRQRVLLR